MRNRLIWAMVAYAVLGILAWLTLDGDFLVGTRRVSMRDLVWIMLGAFALKTLIAHGRFRSEEPKDE